MTTFDEAIPIALGVCEALEGFPDIEACLVRDLSGRIRLVLRSGNRASDKKVDATALEAQLARQLGGFFAGPILCTWGKPAQATLARAVFDRASTWPPGWPTKFQRDGAEHAVDTTRWRGLARVLAKEAWLAAPVDPPWPLHAGTPTIVSFHSFKGGVGRSTLLALCARRLARQGHRVVAIDLDFEAPGLGSLFEAPPVGGRGALDWVVDHIALRGDHVSPVDAAPAAKLSPTEANQIRVLPAGEVGWSHIEKLGRLDYASAGGEPGVASPVESALRALLGDIRRRYEPRFVFLDARSGLHDLGGLSLHALSHVDVLVTRDGPQNLLGLKLVLQAIAQRQGDSPRHPIVVHAMAPFEGDNTDVEIVKRFGSSVYDAFTEHYYGEEDLPALEDTTAFHSPLPFRFRDELRRLHLASQFDDSLVDASDVRAITDRLVELSGVEDVDPADGEGGRA